MRADLSIREILAFGLGGLVALAGFNSGVAHARMVPSGSMAPTLVAGDRLVVSSLASHTPRRGEVLVFKPPFRGLPETGRVAAGTWLVGEDAPYIKRCIGVPGDVVQVRKGVGVSLNGQLLSESYVLEKPRYDWGPQTVPAGRLFMLGDNRNSSFDSHYWGFLPLENVIGRPAAVIWPLARARKF